MRSRDGHPGRRITPHCSGCVDFQVPSRFQAVGIGGHGVLHFSPVLAIVLRMVSSLRMQAVITTLKGLPARVRRSAVALINGLNVRAVSGGMEGQNGTT